MEITAYVTSSCLSKGVIRQVEGSISNDHDIHFVVGSCAVYTSPDWHIELREAMKEAEKKRLKKLVSLKKQIQKLENMEFKVKREFS